MGVSGQLHAPVTLPPGKRPGAHCTRGWMNRRAGLEGLGNSRPDRDLMLGDLSS
jgi:hypothetical protein